MLVRVRWSMAPCLTVRKVRSIAMHCGWVQVANVAETLARRPAAMHVIVTGRYTPHELIDCADLVTEMREIKHPYTDQGIKAQPGIEF